MSATVGHVDDHLLQAEPGNAKYKAAWRRFTAFVQTCRDNGKLPQPNPNDPESQKYISRTSVDMFFREVVAHLKVEPTTAASHRPALQWYADKREHTNPDSPFIVSDNKYSTVSKALQFQARNYTDEFLSKHHDAHKDLPTDVLTRADHLAVIKAALKNDVTNWANFAIGWNVCHATFVRTDTLNKLRLCDIKADANHGPENGNPNDDWCLSFILHAGQTKTDKPKRGKRPK
jgi:hypothetical protein